jgi:hypothetical protein
MTLPQGDRDADRTVTHIPLDDLELHREGLHFLETLLSARIVSSFSPFLIIQFAYQSGYFEGLSYAMILLNYTMVCVFLIGLWFLDRNRRIVMFVIAVIFAAEYSYIVMGRLRDWDYVNRLSTKYTFSWVSLIAYGCSFVVLSAVNWQVIRIVTTASRASELYSFYIISSAPVESRLVQLLLRVFGIHPISMWLSQRWRRWTAAGMFFIQTCVFAAFMSLTLFYVFLYFPTLANGLAFFAPCFDPEKANYQCWILLPMSPFLIGGIHVAGLIAIMILLIVLRFAARSFTRTSLENLISKDQRPIILFLRSFRDDQVKLKKPRSGIVMRMVSFGEPRPMLDHILLEEGTCYGPVVALGAPGVRRPFGAARTYVSNEQWRETVIEFCRQSGMVVVTVDETESVRWEVQHILAQKHLPKTLFLLPPRLIGSAEVGRILPLVLTQVGEPAPEWISTLVHLLQTEQRYCVGWFWKTEHQVEVLTTRRNSYVAYAIAVGIFLSRFRAR